MRTHGYFLVTRLMQDRLGGPFSPYGFRPGEPDDADHAELPTALVVAMLALGIVVVVAIALLSPGSDPQVAG